VRHSWIVSKENIPIGLCKTIKLFSAQPLSYSDKVLQEYYKYMGLVFFPYTMTAIFSSVSSPCYVIRYAPTVYG